MATKIPTCLTPTAGGPGNTNDSGQSLGHSESWKASLGDVDGDGDPDAFAANGLSGGGGNSVWINDDWPVIITKRSQ